MNKRRAFKVPNMPRAVAKLPIREGHTIPTWERRWDLWHLGTPDATPLATPERRAEQQRILDANNKGSDVVMARCYA